MKTVLFVFLFGLSLVNVYGQSDATRAQNFNVRKNIALEGYDPISYFNGKPIEGKEELKLNYKNVVYQFASQDNLTKFKLHPEKFEPAYGGWCAYAMGESGEKVKIDPETFTILDGKLYLFYNFWGNNTLEDWKKNEQKLKDKADLNWKNIVR